jgi:HK97 family phage prohead protease
MRIKVGSPEMRTRKPGLTELQNVRHERPIPAEYGGLYLRSADGTREAITSAERANDPGDLVFSGYASTFNDEYEVYGGPENGWGWFEKIDRGAFQTTMQQKPDVMFLINHTDMPLARTKSGTLRLRVDDHGLFSEADLEKSDPDVGRLVPKMARRDMDEMSFAFRVVRDRWEAHPDFPDDPMSLRVIEEVSLQKGDVSIVNYGANPFTAGAKIDVVQAAQFLAQADPADMRKLSDQDRAMAARAIAKISADFRDGEAAAVIQWGEGTLDRDGKLLYRHELRSPTTDELAQGLHDLAMEMGASCEVGNTEQQQEDSGSDPEGEDRSDTCVECGNCTGDGCVCRCHVRSDAAAPGDAAGAAGEGAAGDAAAAAAAEGGTAGDAQPASAPGIPDGAPDTTAEPGEHEAPVQTPQDAPPSEPTPEQEPTQQENGADPVYEAHRQALLDAQHRREAAEAAASAAVAALSADPAAASGEEPRPELVQAVYDDALKAAQERTRRAEAAARQRAEAERAAAAEVEALGRTPEPEPEPEPGAPPLVQAAYDDAVRAAAERTAAAEAAAFQRAEAERAAAAEVAAMHDEPEPTAPPAQPPIIQSAYDEALRNMQEQAQQHESEAAARLAAERAAAVEVAELNRPAPEEPQEDTTPAVDQDAYAEGRQAAQAAQLQEHERAERAAQAERAAAAEIAAMREQQQPEEPQPVPEPSDPEQVQSAYDETRLALQERARQREAAAEAAQVELARMRERGEPAAAAEADTRQQEEPPPPLIQSAYEVARTNLRVRAEHQVEETQREVAGRPPGVPSIKDLIEMHERDAAKVTELNQEAYMQTRRALLGESA